jgi:hypothetical protein
VRRVDPCLPRRLRPQARDLLVGGAEGAEQGLDRRVAVAGRQQRVQVFPDPGREGVRRRVDRRPPFVEHQAAHPAGERRAAVRAQAAVRVAVQVDR